MDMQWKTECDSDFSFPILLINVIEIEVFS